jgi:tetratricopeptide (TPR) repeat protein
MRALVLLLLLAFATASPSGSAQRSAVDPAAARSMLERYAQGGVAVTQFSDSRLLLQSLDRAAQAWVVEAPADERERRRQLVAAMLLELSEGPVDGAVITVRRDLLEWACAWLRRDPASEFERVWMLASLALYQPARVGGTSPLETEHTKHALSRFPKDPEVLLAELSARPEAFLVTNRPGADPARVARGLELGRIAPEGTRGPRQIAETRAALQELAGHEGAGAEASARLGLLLFHLNELPASVAALTDGATRARAPELAHFAWLNAALALDAQGRRADAIDAYRRATRAVPDALSSSMALSAALFMAGGRLEAAAIAERAFARTPAVVDPWHRAFMQRREFDRRRVELRGMVSLPNRILAGESQRAVTSGGVAATPMVQVDRATPVPESTQRPTFRAAASGVVVDVSVFDGRKPVTGLTAADFEILDEGVPQPATVVSVDTIPLDVTLMLDVAQSAYNLGDGQGLRQDAERAVRDLPPIVKLLRPVDRIRAIAVRSGTISEVIPMQPAGSARVPASLTAEVHIASALADGVTAALIHATPAERRHLVVIFTDGVDTSSAVTQERVREIALHADPLLHLARRFTTDELVQQKAGKAPGPLGRFTLWPTPPTVIEDIVRAAGGDVRHAQPGESMVDDVRRVLERFRQSYVLHYQPVGVSDTGWHALTVRVKAKDSYQVRARRGYFAGAR